MWNCGFFLGWRHYDTQLFLKDVIQCHALYKTNDQKLYKAIKIDILILCETNIFAGTANLQTSTAHRLQKVKNRFIEVDLSTPTPTRRISSPSRQGPGRERHRLLLNMMNRAASAKSTRSSISRGSNLLSSPSKSRLSLVSAKNVQISLRNGAVSPTKSLSLSMSMSRSRPNSTMSKTCVIS